MASEPEQLDLSADEIIMLARLFAFVPDMAVTPMPPDGEELGLLTSHPDFNSLFEKVEKALEREDVKAIIDAMPDR
jgi:hypothetical protein